LAFVIRKVLGSGVGCRIAHESWPSSGYL